MGRQWLQKKREINANRRGKLFNKRVREVAMAAKAGGPDPAMNARLAVAVEAARKQGVSNEAIGRAIDKGAGVGSEKLELELVTYEGYAPHHVPVIVECLTDNRNRTAPEMRVLFRKGQLGAKVAFLFEHVGVVEAVHPEARDAEEAAIEAGAQEVEPLEEAPAEAAAAGTGARFLTERTDLDAVTKALAAAGWVVSVSEMRYLAREPVRLAAPERTEVEEFLEALDDHDDVHRVHAALDA